MAGNPGVLRMIEFDCPRCGEPMEISDRQAGRQVRCVGCGERIAVPEPAGQLRPAGRTAAKDDGLSRTEFLLFGLLFFLIPCANVIVSSVLYYVWRAERPRRARQINGLGFAIFGCHVVIRVLVWVLLHR